MRVINRDTDSESFKKEVDERFPMIKGLSRYNHCLFRNDSIVDSKQFGNFMIEHILKKRPNFKLRSNTKINGYTINKETKYVQTVNLNTGEKIQTDLLILSTGPQTTQHLWQHFKTVFP